MAKCCPHPIAGPAITQPLSPPTESILINTVTLRDICQREFQSFSEFGTHFATPQDRGYFFRDGGNQILGVAHLDSVLPATHFEANDGVVRCPALDDRLGAYILIDLLPSLGVYFDLLLTDAEEQGRSTAAYFKPPRAYNWMFSFDRAGTDVVLYQYENRDLRELLQKNGFSVGLGSRSDIAYLGHLGCKGMNVGCGYHGAHRPTCHMILSETETMVSQFAAFWRLYAATPLPHRSQPPGAGRRSGRRYTDRAIE